MARIAHLAMLTRDVERLCAFYVRYFDAHAGAPYHSERQRGFASRFLTFPEGESRLEVITIPELESAPAARLVGYAHLALAVGSRDAVVALTERMRDDGVQVISEPRVTGDGYFESVVRDPDGNEVEVTA